MKKRYWFHLFGIMGLVIIGDFWIRYYRYCRFNQIAPFNKFVHQYAFAADQLIILMLVAVIAGGLGALAHKLWLLISLVAFGTLLFVFSQIT